MIKIYLHVHLILDWNRWFFRNLKMAFFAKWNMKWVTVVTISKKRPQRSSVVLNEASWHTLPLLLFRISLLPPLVWNWLFVAWFFILYPNVLSTFDKWLLGCRLIKNQKRMGIKERQKDEINQPKLEPLKKPQTANKTKEMNLAGPWFWRGCFSNGLSDFCCPLCV